MAGIRNGSRNSRLHSVYGRHNGGVCLDDCGHPGSRSSLGRGARAADPAGSWCSRAGPTRSATSTYKLVHARSGQREPPQPSAAARRRRSRSSCRPARWPRDDERDSRSVAATCCSCSSAWSPSRSSSRCSRRSMAFIALAARRRRRPRRLRVPADPVQAARAGAAVEGAVPRRRVPRAGAVHERAVRAGSERVERSPARAPPADRVELAADGVTLGSPGADRRGGSTRPGRSSSRSTRRARSRSSASRRAIRSCASAIRAVHRREFLEARELIAEAAAYLAEAESALGGHADVRYGGFLNDAKKEFAEANLTLAFVAGPRVADRRRARRRRAAVPQRDGRSGERAAPPGARLPRGATKATRPSGCSALMDEVYGLLVTDRLPRRAHRWVCAVRPTRCAACSSAPAAT